MKSKKGLFAGVLLAVIGSLVLTACGAETESSRAPAGTEATAATTEAAEPTEPENGQETSAPSGKYGSIKEYAESELIREQVDSLNESFNALGLTVDIFGEGNKLVYQYTYNTPVTDLQTESLEQSLASQESLFESTASALTLVVDVEDPVVAVVYLNADGTEILSKEFASR